MDADSANEHLHRQLVRLGDMMGDGLHLEPGGGWISREYRKVAKALGFHADKPRANNVEAINKGMSATLEKSRCKCGGKLQQTRSGSMRAACDECGLKYQFKRRKS